MKRFDLKRMIALFFVLAMILPSTLACNKKKDEGAEGETSANVETDVALKYDDNGYLMDDLPELDFDGATIRVLAWEENRTEFDISVDKMNTNALSAAVYMRDIRVRERLNIDVVYSYAPGSSYTYNEYLQMADAMQSSGDGVDVFASQSRVAADLMKRGYTQDLKKVKHVDLDKPWWSQSLIENATIYDRLYFATGDISPSLFQQTMVIFFNKSMAETYIQDDLTRLGAKSLYELVDNGQWTLGTMMEMCSGVGSSLDEKKDISDTFGFAGHPIYFEGFYYASGMRTYEVQEDGSISISPDMGSEKAHTLCEKLGDFFDTADAVGSSSYYGNEIEAIDAWYQGRSLFFLDMANHAVVHNDRGLKFGILPIPKYDTAQADYSTISGIPFTLWSVSRNVKDTEMVGAFLECMSSEAYRLVTPALYDTMLRTQTSESVEDYEMWETIRRVVKVDCGRVLDTHTNTVKIDFFRDAVMARGEYMSAYAERKDALTQNLLALNRTMATIETVYGN